MYNIVTLQNGLRLVYEKIPFVRSVSAGIWVGTGSSHESVSNNGVSHFIEHMLFKGTDARTAKEIAEDMDEIGGQINAFTGKECTCYYAKALDTHLERTFEILSDMFYHSKFDPKDMKVEKKVILEEISMYEDTPEEVVHDLIQEISWKGHPLGLSILGTQQSLSQMDRPVIADYMTERYLPANTVLSVAGHFDTKKLLKMATQYFGNSNKPFVQEEIVKPATFLPSVQYKEKDIEQVHLCLGFEGIENDSERLYDLLALNNIFGGGMSSRLFQKIREEKGLAYTVYSYPSSYAQAGLFNIYAGTHPKQFEQVLSLIAKEMMTVAKRGVTESELRKTKEQLKANYILGLESTSSRMNSMGKSLLLLNQVKTQEEILEKLDAVSLDSIKEIIDRVFDFHKMSMAVVGQVDREISLQDYLS
jgi:predicted Zn-dependent peptidase